MSAHIPAVSVSLVTYNHERYIGEAIRSVLQQTFSDLEVIVVDDGSTDRTAEVIASFDDPRLVSIRQENQGPGAATNRALAACRGKYVALMSGDDLCYPDRIQKQLQAYAADGPCIQFAGTTFIDEEGVPTVPRHYEGVLDTSSRTRAEIYHRFFFRGNFINGITAFTERRLLGEAPYDPLLFQTQDFALWIRLIKRHDMRFLPEPVIHYRIRANQQNLSGKRVEYQIRSSNESLFLMRRFFDDVPLELFREAFARELRRPDFSSPEEAACEQAFLLLGAPYPMQKIVGLERLYDLLSTPRTAAVLHECYAFTHLDFVELLMRADAFGKWPQTSTFLFVDSGKGFNPEEVRERTVYSESSAFTLTFDLNSFSRVRSLRWDPVELHHCRVELQCVTWQDKAGRRHTLDPATVTSNGTRDDSGGHCFETHDPMFFLPIEGEISSLRLEGCWEIKNIYNTVCQTLHIWQTASQQLAEAQQQVHQLTQSVQKARDMAAAREEQLLHLQGSLSYRIGERLSRLRSKLAPEQTWRYHLYQLLCRSAKVWRKDSSRGLRRSA